MVFVFVENCLTARPAKIMGGTPSTLEEGGDGEASDSWRQGNIEGFRFSEDQFTSCRFGRCSDFIAPHHESCIVIERFLACSSAHSDCPVEVSLGELVL